MHFTEYDTRLAAYAAITDGDQMLVTWFNGSTPCWSLPGGGVEYDESIEDAVVREAHEETGFHVALGDLLVMHHFVAEASGQRRPFKSQRFIFDATIIGGTLGTIEVGGTTDRAEWVSMDDLLGQDAVADIVRLAIAAVRRADDGGAN